MLSLVEDTKTYKKINKNLTNSIQTKNNWIVSVWKGRGYITEEEKTRLTTYTGSTPRMYGLPKIHKPNNPLRPIVSNINAPTYHLSKFLAQIINKSINHKKYNVQNSYVFKDYIVEQTIPKDHILISLDVVSLFTNIPISLVKQGIDQRWYEITKHTNLPLHEFHRGIDLILNNTFFFFVNNNEYYNALHVCS